MFENFEEAVQLHLLSDTEENKDSNRVIITALSLYFIIKESNEPEKSYEEYELEALLETKNDELRKLVMPIVTHLFKSNHLVDLEIIKKLITDIKLVTVLENCIGSEE